MQAAEIGRGLRGEAVRQLRVAHIAPAQDGALDGVVGEDEVLGQVGAAEEQGVHIQDALARKAAPARQVHPDLAAGPAVGVRAARAGHEPGEGRLHRRGELHAHARVYEPVSGHDDAPGAEHRAVQGVEHRAYELPRRARQQARVRVQGEDVFRVPKERRVPREDGEPAGIPAQQARQGQQGPALALVPRPDAVPLPQRPAAAEEEKAAAVFVV